MKKPALDLHPASANTVNAKDKRTLVLFLLGLALLSLDFWPRVGEEVRLFYGIVQIDATQPWRLLSLPSVDALNTAETRAGLGLTDHSKVLPLVSEKNFTEELPASLFVFLNRPLPINRADMAALEMLPGVGPHLANAILSELQHQGRFSGPDDLLEVSGIGPMKLQHLLPLISFE